ncbi:glycerol dehydrogenase [Hyphomonas sp. FCG-A18]|uniref:glycerol dehydrogenase n=1 Tax=Hyphomonas sp. FCG-A18 TaxID=3080019 RepID=UPI002B2ECB66|nr:glycerol dehydrogenase [Hyphomonas sp. FCG-A18]
MITTSIFPGRYVQGAHALKQLGEEAKRLGQSPLVLIDPFVLSSMKDEITEPLAKLTPILEKFDGECSQDEIDRLLKIATEEKVDLIIGIGGGKAMDTAKAVAHAFACPVIIVPTIASTDAPCSALSVVYTPDGQFERYEILPNNPETVLVDTQLIAKAPVRFLVAGMGDALATWFEAESCRIRRAANMTGRLGTMTAYALAELCYKTLMDYGRIAATACAQGVITPALEHVVEANTLLSGLGFESGGLAACHAIHNGLTTQHETHAYWHGEKVAIGVLAGLFLTDQPSARIDEVFDFCLDVGLPVTLADIGLDTVTEEQLYQIAEAACAPGETIHNEPHEISPERVVWALKAADAEGRRRKPLHARTEGPHIMVAE